MICMQTRYALLAVLMLLAGCGKGDGGWKPLDYDTSGDYHPGLYIIAYKVEDFKPNRTDGCNHFAFRLPNDTRVDTFDYAKNDDGEDGIIWESGDVDFKCDVYKVEIDGNEIWYVADGFESQIPRGARSGAVSMSSLSEGQQWDWTAWHCHAYDKEIE